MYVCICREVTDRHIHHAVRNGVVTFEQLRMELGVSQCCGRCRHVAHRVFQEALDAHFPGMPSRVILPGTAAA